MIVTRWVQAGLLAGIGLLLAATNETGVVRRLTHSQYNHTVRDLLGDETAPADQFPEEDFVNGFRNQISAQDIPPLLAEAYNNAAERLARNAFLAGDDANHLLPCKPRSPDDAGCAAAFVRKFGARAFRRPLTAAEQQRYAALLVKEGARTGDFLRGAQLVIEAMLQSPKFLFRLERGGEWRAYEIATRLSYFLWDSMPDDELTRAAAAGELATPDGLDKQVRRMVADRRAHQMVDEFVSEWLRFDLVLNAVKDRTIFPQFTPELATAMAEETRRLVSDLVWNDRNFMDLFRANYSFLNSDLAALYAVPAPASEFGRVEFPAASERAGIFGQGTFLAATSKPGETSPTVRGYFVRQHFLCHEIPDPPPGTNSNLPPVTAARPQTNRERLKEHMANATCMGCHSMMDPVGLAFEKFDAIGRHRDKQAITFLPEHHGANRYAKPVTMELDVDTTGNLTGVKDATFHSPTELGAILAQNAECQECIVKQLFRYAWGRRETAADAATIRRGAGIFRESGFRLKDVIVFLAKAMAMEDKS
jgi:Protein of unknown function (DUF1592)/Protein of unknown function (DUF1588)/Protein of unknown function (DUF1587)/Protein of unknown function (DUF1595)/Protein of unknown function (DUF1585)